ncbi:carotenoid oxygenase [Saccharomonospora sp. CUA-673]|uniref:carotenoid oxygenase family protein n=1 Tax=Saccharomonospora sp. CUA-673 TaxID=1904969 RepID=UPI000964885D|nr:carotenoid oxygenase family protein [Saccharomonospora sp. CUA-673]OLT40529.1 carotenoid oxygenase [Saccharomonospora sp. CUA-673]
MSNAYLEGQFAPVQKELTAHDLPVTGTIPAHLDGRYLRNGPNPAGDIDPDTYNWFIGDGMVHGIRIRDGRAEWYRNRWVRAGRVARALGEQPPPRTRGAGIELIGANTNVLAHAGRTLALVEGGNTNYELDDELDTVGACDFDGTVHGGFTAHPKHDPETGEMHAVSYRFGLGNHVRYEVIGTDGRARRAVDVEVTGSPMMHDFALTRRHVVFYDFPVTFDPRQAAEMTMPRGMRAPARLLLSALIGRVRVPDPVAALVARGRGAPTRYPYRWNRNYPARIGVLPREAGSDAVRWFDVPPCYVFHTLNAFDDDAGVVIDVVRHAKVFDDDLTGPSEGNPTLERWRLDLRTGAVDQQRLCDRPQEFPRIDENLLGTPHRFGYTVEIDEGRLLKHDLSGGGTTSTRTFGGEGHPIGEFVFEPNPGATSEDDGVLMGFVHDLAEDRSDLAFLDAGTLETIGTVHLPHRVPAGFHGNWIPTTP